MDKVIWKLSREQSYFVGNVLVWVKDVFFPSCPCLNVSCRGIFEHTQTHIYLYISCSYPKFLLNIWKYGFFLDKFESGLFF